VEEGVAVTPYPTPIVSSAGLGSRCLGRRPAPKPLGESSLAPRQRERLGRGARRLAARLETHQSLILAFSPQSAAIGEKRLRRDRVGLTFARAWSLDMVSGEPRSLSRRRQGDEFDARRSERRIATR
jgi:hypothetical protein